MTEKCTDYYSYMTSHLLSNELIYYQRITLLYSGFYSLFVKNSAYQFSFSLKND